MLFGRRKYLESCRIEHPRLGEIAVKVLATARRITARWKSTDLLCITIPPGTTQSLFDEALAELEPRLVAKRPKNSFYTPGWQYVTPEMTFEVTIGTRTGYYDGRVDRLNGRTTFMMPPELAPMGSSDFNDWIIKALKRYSKTYAERLLVPMATDMASQLGLHPSKIGISYGERVLGRCNSRGEILLSRNLVFYPIDLRRMVIAHELAHLTHLNHSASFHRLLDSYLGGNLCELNRRFKAFKLPFL